MANRNADGLTRRIARLEEDRALLAVRYPDLQVAVDATEGTAVAEGPITLGLPDASIDPIEVRIVFGSDYPEVPPKAYDAAGRWPVDPDRHIIADGRFCLYFDRVDAPDLRQAETLAGWMLDLVLFLHQQLVFDAIGGRRWPGEEWPHGERSAYATYLVEGLRELRPAQRPAVWHAIRHGGLPRNSRCLCGSQRKLKHCHLDRWGELGRVARRAGLGGLTHSQLSEAARG